MSVRIQTETHTFRDAFARHVGRGRRFSVHDIAPLVGKSPSLVEKWVTGCRVPDADALARLFGILGDAFVRHYIAPHGYQVRAVSEVPAMPCDVMLAGAQAACVVADAQADGVIDRAEAEAIDAAATRFADMARRIRQGRCG